MRSGRNVLGNRREWMTLMMVLLVLAGVVFSPTLRSVVVFGLHPKVVRTPEIEASVPLDWVVQIDGSTLKVWRPCRTVFCSEPRPFMRFKVELGLSNATNWREAATEVLRSKSFSPPVLRQMDGTSGHIECLESKLASWPGVLSTCLAPEAALVSTFEGDAAAQPTFYSTLRSARIVRAGKKE